MPSDPKQVKAYEPCKTVHIHVDLEDLSRKAAKYGPARVIGETLLNLCLLANDHLTRIASNGALPKIKEAPADKKEKNHA